MGRIAAGTPIEAIQTRSHIINMPPDLLSAGEHFALEVRGDSMIEAGILDGDIALIRKSEVADTGDIVVALIDDEEATLKRFRRRGASIALEPANTAYEVRISTAEPRAGIQGKLVGLISGATNRPGVRYVLMRLRRGLRHSRKWLLKRDASMSRSWADARKRGATVLRKTVARRSVSANRARRIARSRKRSTSIALQSGWQLAVRAESTTAPLARSPRRMPENSHDNRYQDDYRQSLADATDRIAGDAVAEKLLDLEAFAHRRRRPTIP